MCPPNFDDHEECTAHYNAGSNTWDIDLTSTCSEVYDSCLDSFLLWAMGFFVALYYFFLSHMCVARMTSERNLASETLREAK